MTARKENASRHVMTKPLPCQRGHKMYLNKCWPNPSNVSEDSTYVGQTHPMPARTLHVSQQVMTKHFSFQQRHKMYLNKCWPNPSLVREDKKLFSTCEYKTAHMPPRTQNASQLMFPCSLCQQGHKFNLNMCLPKPSQASDDTKYNALCVDQTLTWQRGIKM